MDILKQQARRQKRRPQAPAFPGAKPLFGGADGEEDGKSHQSLKNRIRSLRRLLSKPVRAARARARAMGCWKAGKKGTKRLHVPRKFRALFFLSPSRFFSALRPLPVCRTSPRPP